MLDHNPNNRPCASKLGEIPFWHKSNRGETTRVRRKSSQQTNLEIEFADQIRNMTLSGYPQKATNHTQKKEIH